MMISRRSFLAWPMVMIPVARPPLLVGDSLAFMARPYAPDFDVRGRGGTNAHQWLRKGWLRQELARFQPDVLLISLGTNDVGVPAVLRALPVNAAQLVALGLKMGCARVIWLVPPNARGLRVAEAVGGALAEMCYPPADVQLYKNDVHPTSVGYKTWLAHVREFVG